MDGQTIAFGFDKEGVWNRVSGRLSIFLDSNGWIQMADEADDTACRVRDRLQALVASGRVFCPLSWGVLEELFKQSGDSLKRTARLMEELSLNAIFVMRTELYQWEFARSVRRASGEPVDDSLLGLFAPPVAFVGSRLCVRFEGVSIGPQAQADAQAYMQRELSNIGVVELSQTMGGTRLDETPPAYSVAAKKAMERFKGRKAQLFLEEAGNCFSLYIRPLLLTYPPEVIRTWSAQFGPADNEEAWFLNALAQLPALHNYINIMVVADSLPDRKDAYNHFMDNEIMVAPLAYADVFVSRDKGVRDLLRSRTKILSRTKCQYCDSLSALETWLAANVV